MNWTYNPQTGRFDQGDWSASPIGEDYFYRGNRVLSPFDYDVFDPNRGIAPSFNLATDAAPGAASGNIDVNDPFVSQFIRDRLASPTNTRGDMGALADALAMLGMRDGSMQAKYAPAFGVNPAEIQQFQDQRREYQDRSDPFGSNGLLQDIFLSPEFLMFAGVSGADALGLLGGGGGASAGGTTGGASTLDPSLIISGDPIGTMINVQNATGASTWTQAAQQLGFADVGALIAAHPELALASGGILGGLASGIGGAATSILGGISGNKALGAGLGALAGVLGGSKQAGTTTTVEDLPEWAKPYAITGLSGMADAYNAAPGMSPITLAGGDYMQDVIGGKYLTNNPYLDAVYDKAAGKVGSGVNSLFSKAGRYG